MGGSVKELISGDDGTVAAIRWFIDPCRKALLIFFLREQAVALKNGLNLNDVSFYPVDHSIIPLDQLSVVFQVVLGHFAPGFCGNSAKESPRSKSRSMNLAALAGESWEM